MVLRLSHWLQYYDLAAFAHAVVETKERWKKGNASRPNVLPSAALFYLRGDTCDLQRA